MIFHIKVRGHRLNSSSNNDDLDKILNQARSDFWDANYYASISAVERAGEKFISKEDHLRANICLCVFFDFLSDIERFQSIKRDLMCSASWTEEEFKDALMIEMLRFHSGFVRARDQVREKLTRYCDENLQIGQPNHETYLCKAWLEKDNTANWISCLDKAVQCRPYQIDDVLDAVGQEIYRKRHGTDNYEIFNWLSGLEQQTERCVLFQGLVLSQLGDVDLSVEKFKKIISGRGDGAKFAKRELIGLYCQQKKFEDALELAESMKNYSSHELAKIFLQKGDAIKAKEVLTRDVAGRDRSTADLFLKYRFYDEALEVFYRMQPFSDSYPYYTAALAMWKNALKNGISDETLSYLKKEMLPAVVWGRYLEQRVHHAGSKTKLSDLELSFELLEARYYFVLNLENIKRVRREIRKDNIKPYSGVSISHFNYRDRLMEIYQEIKRRGANSSDHSRDFRARNYEKTFQRAINTLEKLSQRVLTEISKVTRVAAISNASGSIDDMWSAYWAHFEEQDYQRCLDVLRGLAALEPESPFVQQERARTLKVLGRYPEAIDCLGKALPLFEKYHERSASGYNLLQHVYADMIEKANLPASEKRNAIEKLNSSFEAWFKSDISLFGKLSEPLPEIGLRHQDPVKAIGGKTLYKYCSFNINSIAVLSDLRVYFSKAEQLNDPFDMGRYREVVNGVDYKHVSDKVKNRVSCFCTTLRRDNLQMWAHYADAFTGICIGYQISKLPSEIGWRGLQYPEKKNRQGALVDTLFVKSSDWSYEEEVRFLRFSDGPPLVKIHPANEDEGIKGHISEIILGSKFDLAKNWPILKAILKSINTEYASFSIPPVAISRASQNTIEGSDALDILVADDLTEEVQ